MEAHIHLAGFVIDHVTVFLVVAAEDESLLAVLHAVLAEELEEFLYPVSGKLCGFRTVEGRVHFHAGHPRLAGGMRHTVPFTAAFQILLLHLFQSGELRDVFHYQVNVDMTALLGGGHILSGIVVELVHHLLLETPESAFDGLALAVVRHGGLVQVAYLLEKDLRFRPLVPALVVGNYLIRFNLPRFQRHAVGLILCKEILRAERVAQEHLRTCVHHLVHVDGTCHHTFVLLVVVLVIEVQFRTVTIP